MANQITDTLHRLDGDVLLSVFELLRPKRRLRPLSLACKWIRQACCPVLFRHCIIPSSMVDRLEGPAFIPCSLWPYVCTIVFSGAFERSDVQWLTAGLRSYDRYDARDTVRHLGAMKRIGDSLRTAFNSMTALRSISIYNPLRDGRYPDPPGPPGVPPYILAALLSTPSLRDLEIRGPLCHPDDCFQRDLFSDLANVSDLRYDVGFDRPAVHIPLAEREEISFIVDRAHPYLEQLHLPIESAPIAQMAMCQWPMMQGFSLRGERVNSTPPLVCVLSKMPCLRSLSLLLAESTHGDPPPVWPPALNLQCEWRDLEDLCVTHPNPDDELYSHLPQTLDGLALRCWPRHYKHSKFPNVFAEAGLRWTSPLLLSSQMLRILRKIDAPRLEILEIEFRADWSDAQLFRHIGASFPSLIFLRIHRYRAEGEEEIPLVEIGRALCPLQKLQVLMLHLDFIDLPRVDVYQREHWGDLRLTPEREQQLRDSDATLAHAANVLATLLGPSLECIYFLRPVQDYPRQWEPFLIRSDVLNLATVLLRIPGRIGIDTIPCICIPTVTDYMTRVAVAAYWRGNKSGPFAETELTAWSSGDARFRVSIRTMCAMIEVEAHLRALGAVKLVSRNARLWRDLYPLCSAQMMLGTQRRSTAPTMRKLCLPLSSSKCRLPADRR
ncbi:hypothetical protein NUW54_g1247 [Trametes sanguinea]|uniref:Uncharacterized protein n=1 Tax=Trametes sanguinea TaxID=158606 RepID=A0ACC1Q6W8_9APHY|nr:hypothetical protein NUW54_g1247 [Trametes sanguinea]